ncbi:MAG TPA: Sec-independent protein translocase protein TatB [Hyphomicrobium sp.]|nr:Sec-independent protein translocase protein TatB [Hyphomicrobium sp.]
MFDLTSSKLLILAIVALIVVGPKDLPILLRTVGKYLGIVRRHAAEFRAQFDEALREAELLDLKKEIEGVGHEVRSTIEQGGTAIDEHVMTARTELDGVIGGRPRPVESEDEPAAGASGAEPPAPSKSEAP